MFACHLYPATDDVPRRGRRARSRYQARRIGHHVALWCGDNELLGALNWFEESRSNRDRYLVAYDRLNRTIETALKRPLPGANWWPSSPSPGPMSFGDAWHDDTSGDMHFWSVWHEGRDFEHYRDVRPRFCSEFGFQSYTSLPVIQQLRRRGRPQHRLAGDGEPPEERRRQRPHRRDDVPLLPLPQGLRQLRLALPDPAGPRDQDRGRLLALAQAALHGHALLAAQRHLAGRLLVEPRLRRRLEAPAPHGAALLPAGPRRGHPRRRRPPRSSRSTTPPPRSRSSVELRAVTLDGATRPLAEAAATVGTDAARRLHAIDPAARSPPARCSPSAGPPRTAWPAATSSPPVRWKHLDLRDPRLRARHRRPTAARSSPASPPRRWRFFVTLEADRPGRFSTNAVAALPRPRRRDHLHPRRRRPRRRRRSPSATSIRASST